MNQGKDVKVEIPGRSTVVIKHDGAHHFHIDDCDHMIVVGGCSIRNDEQTGDIVVVPIKQRSTRPIVPTTLGPSMEFCVVRLGKSSNPVTKVSVATVG